MTLRSSSKQVSNSTNIEKYIGNEPNQQDEENQNLYSAVHQTFQQPLLLDLILEFAIRTNPRYNDTDHSLVFQLRLVAKNWKEALTRLLRKNRWSMYKLILREKNSVGNANRAVLDQFASFLQSCRSSESDIIPTFEFWVEADFFHLENYKSFGSFLQTWGKGLTRMALHVPGNGSFPCTFPKLDLPMLSHLQVESEEGLHDLNHTDEGNVGAAFNIVLLTQTLLNSSESLKRVSFSTHGDGGLKAGMQFVALPPSISTLELECSNNCLELELLERNQLQNLVSLEIIFKEESFKPEIMFKVINKFRQQLRVLRIHEDGGFEPPPSACYLRFPVMEALQDLYLDCVLLELETNMGSPSVTFPKLKRLCLKHYNHKMMQKWTTGSGVLLVEELDLQMTRKATIMDNSDTIALTSKTMSSVHLAFSNIRHLVLRTLGTDFSGLKYVFQNMKKLKKLEIDVEWSTQRVLTKNSTHWDALFIGSPVKIVASLKGSRKTKKSAMDNYSTAVSIRMLEELETLALRTEEFEDLPVYLDLLPPSPPLISNLTFELAFMKMPKLRKLQLVGEFRVSPATSKEWENSGGVLYKKSDM